MLVMAGSASIAGHRPVRHGWWVTTTLSVADEQLSDYFRVNSNLRGRFRYRRAQVNGLRAVSGFHC